MSRCYSVLIVEDNPIMRESIKAMVDWENLSCVVVGDVYNGVQAMDILREQGADIVLTDIKMPGMDGLELIEQALAVSPETEFIVLSAYDEFDMVSEAFMRGAKKYILKIKMTAESIVNAVEEAKKLIEDKRTRQDRWSNLQQKAERLDTHEKNIRFNKNTIQSAIFREMLWGIGITAETKKQLEVLVGSLGNGSFRVMVFRLDSYPFLEAEPWAQAKETLKFGMLNVFDELLAQRGISAYFNSEKGEIAVLLFDGDTCLQQQDFFVIYFELREAVKCCFASQVTAGVSNTGRDLQNLKTLYEQAVFACRTAFVNGKGKLYFYRDVQHKKTAVTAADTQNGFEIEQLLSSGDGEAIAKSIRAFAKKQTELARYDNIEEIQNAYRNLCIFFMDYAKRNQLQETVVTSQWFLKQVSFDTLTFKAYSTNSNTDIA